MHEEQPWAAPSMCMRSSQEIVLNLRLFTDQKYKMFGPQIITLLILGIQTFVHQQNAYKPKTYIYIYIYISI